MPSIFIYFTRFASKNFRAARKEKIVDFFVCLHGAGPICKQIKAVEWGWANKQKETLGIDVSKKSNEDEDITLSEQ